MNQMKYPNPTDDAYGIKTVGSRKKPFALWREVVMAYAAPAIMAGIGGLVTSDRGLQIGALTTIGGASALMALIIGLCCAAEWAICDGSQVHLAWLW